MSAVGEQGTPAPGAARAAGAVTVVGIGEDGWAGLGDAAREAVRGARLLLGSTRQLALVPEHESTAGREAWPSPMGPRVEALAAAIRAGGGGAADTVVLASGDPMLHGIGSTLAALVDGQPLHVIPAPSAFALACAQLGWAQHDTPLVSQVAQPATPVAGVLRRAHRAIVYVPGARGAAELAQALRAAGLQDARLVVMERLGGSHERLIESSVGAWRGDADPLHLVALELTGRGGEPTPGGTAPAAPEPRLASTVPGLPDELYGGDGQLTRAEVRAVALAALAPRAGEHLWDVGAGSGTIAIEWCRAAAGASASAVERRADRAATITANAAALGAPGVAVTVGDAPAAVAGLPAPDAIFVGGGPAIPGLLDACWAALSPGGRLVANAVTLEGEQVLAAAFAVRGGRLVRLELAHAEPLGGFTGWKPQRPVVQWSVVRGDQP